MDDLLFNVNEPHVTSYLSASFWRLKYQFSLIAAYISLMLAKENLVTHQDNIHARFLFSLVASLFSRSWS